MQQRSSQLSRHSMAFSSSLFPFFRDVLGAPRTPRDEAQSRAFGMFGFPLATPGARCSRGLQESRSGGTKQPMGPRPTEEWGLPPMQAGSSSRLLNESNISRISHVRGGSGAKESCFSLPHFKSIRSFTFEACHDAHFVFATLCVLNRETWQDGMYRAGSSTVRVDS